MMLTDHVVAVDVGASTISAGLVCGSDGAVVAAIQAPAAGGNALDTITRLVDDVLVAAERRRLRVSGIGIGLPGLIDVEKGALRWTPGAWLPELDDVSLPSVLGERTGHRVFVDNDVNALALAEWMFGAGRGASSIVTIAIGTGVGAGVILDGTLVRGHAGAAGEIGHLSVNRDGPRCACGGIGCLGTYLAGGFVGNRVRDRLAEHPGSVLGPAGGPGGPVTAEILYAAAAAGDPLARALVDEACEALAMGIGALVSLLNPEVIVITGGVVTSLALLREDIMQRARHRTLAAPLAATAVRFVTTDKRATIRGGAALVRYEMARRGREA
jgi:glucokinase